VLFRSQKEAARTAIARLLEIIPGYTIEKHKKRVWLENEEDRKRLLDGMKKAGLAVS